MTLFELLVVSMAVARVARMLIYESGPVRVFDHLRDVLGANSAPVKPGSVAELFNCPWCLSFWVSVFAFGLYAWNPLTALGICLPFAMAFVAGWMIRAST